MEEERTFEMSFDARRDYVRESIAEVLEKDTDAFVELCEEIDNWNGILGDYRCREMWEIDDFFSKPSELLDDMDNFNKDDEYFYFNNYNSVTTSSDKYDVYSDNVDIDELLDEVEDNFNHIDIRLNESLRQLCEILFEEDFGIDEDYDETYDELPEESDEEFTQRIADIM